MSTNNAENLNFRIISGVPDRIPNNFRILTIKELLRWIDEKDIDEQVKEELKKMCSKYPQQALTNWKSNYNIHLRKANLKLKNQVKPEEKEDL